MNRMDRSKKKPRATNEGRNKGHETVDMTFCINETFVIYTAVKKLKRDMKGIMDSLPPNLDDYAEAGDSMVKDADQILIKLEEAFTSVGMQPELFRDLY